MLQEDESRLLPLSEADEYMVREGDPDVRGWRVRSGDGATVGAVDDLIIDTQARRVRYLRVRLGDGSGGGEHVLLPIGLATLHPESDEVSVPNVTVASISSLERHGGGMVEREYEVALRRGIIAAAPDAAADLGADADDFYAHTLFDENRFYEPRRRRSSEREVMENLAVTSISEDDDRPGLVGEVRAGEMELPIMEDGGEEPRA